MVFQKFHPRGPINASFCGPSSWLQRCATSTTFWNDASHDLDPIQASGLDSTWDEIGALARIREASSTQPFDRILDHRVHRVMAPAAQGNAVHGAVKAL
jgi:hypothetical protein